MNNEEKGNQETKQITNKRQSKPGIFTCALMSKSGIPLKYRHLILLMKR